MWPAPRLPLFRLPRALASSLLHPLTFIDVDRSTDQPALGAAGSMVSVQKNK